MRAKLEATLYSEQEYIEDTEIAKQMAKNNIRDPEEQEAFINNYVKAKGTIPEGKYTFNPGVSFEGMQESAVQGIKGAIGILNQHDIDDVYITSTRYDYSGHAPGSAHDVGQGVDVASDKLAALDESSRNIVADRMERAFPGLKVKNEYDDPSEYSTGGHFHLDFTNYKGESRIGASGMSARRMNRIKQMAATMRDDEERRIKEQKDAMTGSVFAEVIKMHDEGVSYEDAQTWARNKAGTDLELFNTYTGLVNKYYSSVGAKSNGGKGLEIGMQDMFEEFLANGSYSGENGKEEFISELLAAGATKSEVNKMLEAYNDWMNGTGVFKYPWSNIKNEVMGDSKLKDGSLEYAAQWNEAQAAGKEFIKQYRSKNNRMPTDIEVIKACREGMTEMSYGRYLESKGFISYFDNYEELKLSPGQLLRAKIAKINRLSNGRFEVIYSDGRMSDEMSGKEIKALFAVEKVK